jgi:hypothetical protein
LTLDCRSVFDAEFHMLIQPGEGEPAMSYQQLTPLAVPDVEPVRSRAAVMLPPPTPALVTEHEVALSTAAAAGSATTRRQWLHSSMVARIGRDLAALSQPGVHYPRHEPSYMEAARMSRAMDRL